MVNGYFSIYYNIKMEENICKQMNHDQTISIFNSTRQTQSQQLENKQNNVQQQSQSKLNVQLKKISSEGQFLIKQLNIKNNNQIYLKKKIKLKESKSLYSSIKNIKLNFREFIQNQTRLYSKKYYNIKCNQTKILKKQTQSQSLSRINKILTIHPQHKKDQKQLNHNQFIFITNYKKIKLQQKNHLHNNYQKNNINKTHNKSNSSLANYHYNSNLNDQHQSNNKQQKILNQSRLSLNLQQPNQYLTSSLFKNKNQIINKNKYTKKGENLLVITSFHKNDKMIQQNKSNKTFLKRKGIFTRVQLKQNYSQFTNNIQNIIQNKLNQQIINKKTISIFQNSKIIQNTSFNNLCNKSSVKFELNYDRNKLKKNQKVRSTGRSTYYTVRQNLDKSSLRALNKIKQQLDHSQIM